MIKEFDPITEKIVFFGKWKYVIRSFFEFDNFTHEDFERILQDVEFHLEMTTLDVECEEYLETEVFLKWALGQLDIIMKDLKNIETYTKNSDEYQNLYKKIVHDFIHLILRDQKRSDESIEMLSVKTLFDDELFEYDISMDGLILEAPDEVEIVQQWLYESFLLLSKEDQIKYYTELGYRIKHVNLVTACETYHLNLFQMVALVDGFRKSVQTRLEQLELGIGNIEEKADVFSKSIIQVFGNYYDSLKIAELSYIMKWVFKFLSEKRRRTANVYEF